MDKRDVVDQFVFDYYVKQCFVELKVSNWIFTENVSSMLKALINMQLEADYPGNKLKSHLLIIVNGVISLKDVGLVNVSDLSRANVLQQLDNIQMSLEELWSESSSTLKEISRQCMFQVYVLFFSIINYDIADEVTRLENFELMERVLKRIQSVTNFQICSEKNIFSMCERALSQTGLHLDIPEPDELWSLIRNLILEASQLIENPCECVCQLEHKLSGETVIERRCRLSDLEEIMGKTPEKCQDKRVLLALREKCEEIKRLRDQSKLSSESDPFLKYLTPKVTLELCNQDSKTQTSHKREDISQKHARLSPIKPRRSLLNFGKSQKPPSHVNIARGKWQTDEEDEFIVKTVEIGEGKWSEIKDAIGSQRSNMQLKDKWRQIPLSKIHKLARSHGLVYCGNKKK